MRAKSVLNEYTFSAPKDVENYCKQIIKYCTEVNKEMSRDDEDFDPSMLDSDDFYTYAFNDGMIEAYEQILLEFFYKNT